MPASRPTLKPGLDLRQLPLTPEEGLVASRLDGTTEVHQLMMLTRLSADVVAKALARLSGLGALVGAVATPATPATKPGAEAEAELAPEGAAFDTPEAEATEALALDGSGTHRRLFQTALQHLDPTERESRALIARDPELSAYCFDPLPPVIQSVLRNASVGLEHARLIAHHHRNPAGLSAVVARTAFASDAGVRRGLLKNPQLPAALMRRLYANRRLLEQFKLTISHDLPEQNRTLARELMRTRFVNGPAEERVELILKTEGRCLTQLTGLPLDGKSTALLCGRPISSTFLVQNLARWGATPPALLAHLSRLELVKRSPMLRTLLERHPNTPKG